MNKIRQILCIVLLMAVTFAVFPPPIQAQDAQPGSTGIGDPLYPAMGNGGYDVQHYTIDLSVDMETNFISGTTTIDALATQNLSAFNLDLSGLEVSEVALNGEPAAFSREDTELTITPTAFIEEGASFTTAVAYSGVPKPWEPAGMMSGTGWLVYRSGAFVLSEPNGAMTWFPNNNHPLDKATYTFRITVPKPFMVAANGLPQGEVDNGDTTTYLWEARDPMASYLASINIAEFRMETREGPDGLPIINFVPPKSTDQILEMLRPQEDMLAFLSELIGPYPFESYGMILIGDFDMQTALEVQTRSSFGLQLVAARNNLVMLHELVHQWFGDSVSVATWQDIWLKEGFATYGEYLWLEHLGYTLDMRVWLSNHYNAMRSTDPLTTDPSPDDLFNISVYFRGAWTLHALRLTVGDDVFFDILRTYYNRFKYSNATTSDFIAVAEEVSGQDLSGFFNAWLYTTEIPPRPDKE